MTVRVFTRSDFEAAQVLYRLLVGSAPLGAGAAFDALLAHPGTQVWGAWEGETAVAMATLHILPNMTQGARPYALIENVVSHAEYRGQGHARRVMETACAAAWAAQCYKIMLLTGKTSPARGFYEKLGFSADEKWGMTQRRAPLRQV